MICIMLRRSVESTPPHFLCMPQSSGVFCLTARVVRFSRESVATKCSIFQQRRYTVAKKAKKAKAKAKKKK